MLNIFLQWEQESSRLDAMVFCRVGWSRLVLQGGIRWPRALDRDTEQGRERTVRGEVVEGHGRRGEAKTEAKAPCSPSGDR